MTARTRVILVAVMAAMLLGASPAAAVASVAEDPVSYDYTADPDDALRNPERGLFASTDSLADIAAPGNRFIDAAAQTGTTAHVYVDLSAYYRSTPDGIAPDTTIPPEMLDAYDTALGRFREAGMKVILRFSYTPKGTSVCGEGVNPGGGAPRPDTLPDADLPTIIDHITQVSGVLNDNADVIASFEAGFLGEFGEWHCSVNSSGNPRDGNAIYEDAKLQVIAAERANFPDRTIAMRYPADISLLESDDRIGSHQDCYASSANDKGTWSPDPATRAGQIALIGRLGETSAVNATVCTDYPERVNCAVAVTGDPPESAEMPAMHFSLFAVDGGQTWLDPYRTGGCWETIVASLGYRLTLRHAELPGSAMAGDTVHVSVALDNAGFAAMFNPRPVYLVFSNDAAQVPVALGIDARSWAPGASAIDQDIEVPDGLADGRYTVSLWLPDAFESLADDPAFAVRFANLDTWRPDSGLNVLGTVAVGPPPDSGSGALADSGADPRMPLTAACILLAVGVVVVTAARRQQGRSGPGAG